MSLTGFVLLGAVHEASFQSQLVDRVAFQAMEPRCPKLCCFHMPLAASRQSQRVVQQYTDKHTEVSDAEGLDVSRTSAMPCLHKKAKSNSVVHLDCMRTTTHTGASFQDDHIKGMLGQPQSPVRS